MIRFKYTSTPLVAAELDEVEQCLGFRFPPGFRDLYLQFNGGRPEKDRFVDDKGPCIVDSFLPIKYAIPALSTLELSFRRVKIDQSLVPDHLVPFAVDPFGNYYCFSIREQDVGAIFLVLMDKHDPQSAIEYLTPSLSSFLAELRTKDPSTKT